MGERPTGRSAKGQEPRAVTPGMPGARGERILRLGRPLHDGPQPAARSDGHETGVGGNPRGSVTGRVARCGLRDARRRRYAGGLRSRSRTRGGGRLGVRRGDRAAAPRPLALALHLRLRTAALRARALRPGSRGRAAPRRAVPAAPGSQADRRWAALPRVRLRVSRSRRAPPASARSLPSLQEPAHRAPEVPYRPLMRETRAQSRSAAALGIHALHSPIAPRSARERTQTNDGS